MPRQEWVGIEPDGGGFSLDIPFYRTSPISRFYIHLPETQIDLNRSMSAKACYRQSRITHNLVGGTLPILFSPQHFRGYDCWGWCDALN
jgi:hypothetical protein